MRTPALIAKALGWPDERPQRPVKLIVWRARPGVWTWAIGSYGSNRNIIFGGGAHGVARSHPAALAIGLDALDTALGRRP